jgi:hypothetical protein
MSAITQIDPSHEAVPNPKTTKTLGMSPLECEWPPSLVTTASQGSSVFFGESMLYE